MKDLLLSAGIVPHLLDMLSQELSPLFLLNHTSDILAQVRNTDITTGLFKKDQMVLNKERRSLIKAFCTFVGIPHPPTDHVDPTSGPDPNADDEEDPFSWMSSLHLGSSVNAQSTQQSNSPLPRTPNSLYTLVPSSRTVTPSSLFTRGSFESKATVTRNTFLSIKRFTLRGLGTAVSKEPHAGLLVPSPTHPRRLAHVKTGGILIRENHKSVVILSLISYVSYAF
jgi:hypothetical protein